MESRSIAIDGPAGAGKSTLARMAARHFGLIYVDTGAMYRCVGLCVLERGADTKDESAVVPLLDTIELELKYIEGVQHVILNGRDVSEQIRLPAVSAAASDVSAMVPVRMKLLEMQRQMAVKYDVIMDGRDIGTVVLPNAGLKVFLTADVNKRAERRLLELREKGVDTTFEDVLREMKIRDHNDSSRAASPLRAADDAVILDTSDLGLEESFELLCKTISERFEK